MLSGSKFKILHVASFIGNIGDNASHCGLYSILHSVLGDNASIEQQEIRKFYKNYHDADKLAFDLDFVDHANRFDLLIIGGGGFLDYWVPDSATGTTIDIDQRALDALTVPLLITSIGCFPHKEVPAGNLQRLEAFLDQIRERDNTRIAFRNDGSVANLHREFRGKYQGAFGEVLDSGFFFEPEIQAPMMPVPSYVAINVSDDQLDMLSQQHGPIDKHAYYQELSLLIEHFSHHQNKHVVLVPHIHGDLKAIFSLLEGQNDFLKRKKISVAPCIQDVAGANLVFSVYQHSELVIGSRFHANVCSLALNANTIGMAVLDRVSHLYQSLDMADSVVQPTPGFADRVIGKASDYERGNLRINENEIAQQKNRTTEFYQEFFARIA
ncbi:hypothetical protein CEK62_14450 [Alcanivorax sp. N3-2A]|nr:hypothetical protein CEK62_14450 [Alcanivorax sp. N3-2A]|tara:strand:+ start:51602 stop:52747 length:1146 start_codon:yes stop_codon:yes gene_type:complete